LIFHLKLTGHDHLQLHIDADTLKGSQSKLKSTPPGAGIHDVFFTELDFENQINNRPSESPRRL
jgi:hypothetical protein